MRFQVIVDYNDLSLIVAQESFFSDKLPLRTLFPLLCDQARHCPSDLRLCRFIELVEICIRGFVEVDLRILVYWRCNT